MKDYVADIQWSPVHPALFVAGDGTGTLYFWDISRSIETPIHIMKLPLQEVVDALSNQESQVAKDKNENKSSAIDKKASETENTVHNEVAITAMKWSFDGRKLAVSTANGDILICTGKENLPYCNCLI